MLSIIARCLVVGDRVSIHNQHVVNSFFPMRLEVSDEYITLQLSYILWREPFEIALSSPHVATCLYSGVVTHVRGGEGLVSKVGNLITELVVTSCDEASLLAVEGMADVKCRTAFIAMFR